jgi:hypothetical protein
MDHDVSTITVTENQKKEIMTKQLVPIERVVK